MVRASNDALGGDAAQQHRGPERRGAWRKLQKQQSDRREGREQGLVEDRSRAPTGAGDEEEGARRRTLKKAHSMNSGRGYDGVKGLRTALAADAGVPIATIVCGLPGRP